MNKCSTDETDALNCRNVYYIFDIENIVLKIARSAVLINSLTVSESSHYNSLKQFFDVRCINEDEVLEARGELRKYW